MLASATNQTVLEYTIQERYVLDTYHGQQYTCEAVGTANDGATTMYVEIQVVSKYHPIVVWSQAHQMERVWPLQPLPTQPMG